MTTIKNTNTDFTTGEKAFGPVLEKLQLIDTEVLMFLCMSSGNIETTAAYENTNMM
jgi:hypothetical protein